MPEADRFYWVVDVGNSAVKAYCLTAGGALVGEALRVPPKDTLPALEQWQAQAKPPALVCVAGTGQAATLQTIAAHLEMAGHRVLQIDRAGAVPFESDYAAGQAGVDRLANIAAINLLKASPAIVVDAGTAVTVDLVDSTGRYLGGWILPGQQLQLNALHAGTRDLPDLDARGQDSATVPRTTEEAIHGGVVHGLLGAITHLVQHARALPGTFHASVFFTGGDGQFLQTRCGFKHCRYHEHLTAAGILALARHQFPAEF